MGNVVEAKKTLQQCLSLHPRSAPCLLLFSFLSLLSINSSTRGKDADEYLERALAADFSIRSAPLYRLIRAFTLSINNK